jgi:hypothetical protein
VVPAVYVAGAPDRRARGGPGGGGWERKVARRGDGTLSARHNMKTKGIEKINRGIKLGGKYPINLLEDGVTSDW